MSSGSAPAFHRSVAVGDIIEADIYGNPARCRVLAVHALGTIDVEVLKPGRCYRISGLSSHHDGTNEIKGGI